MKATFLVGPPPGSNASTDIKINWLLRFAAEVMRNAKQDAQTTADAYKVTGLATPPARTLNASTATTTQTADVLAQFLMDLKTRWPNTGT